MKAIVMFDNEQLVWKLVQLNLSVDFIMSLDRIKRGFSEKGKIRFSPILEVDVASFEATGDKTYIWSSNELPKMPTIEERIAKNKSDILLCLGKL